MMNAEEVQEVMDVIRRHYKSLQCPDFSFVRETLAKRPYEKVIQQISHHFQVEEDTDPNDDVSFGYVLTKGGEQWVLRISMLGPYAVVLRLHQPTGVEVLAHRAQVSSRAEKALITTLADQSIRLLDRDALRMPVPMRLFNAEPENTRVYQALFTDTDSLPWEESPRQG